METTLDKSRQLNDTNPPAQFCHNAWGWDRRDGGQVKGHGDRGRRRPEDENRARERPAAGRPARASRNRTNVCVGSDSHCTHFALCLFVSFFWDPFTTWLWHVRIHLHFVHRCRFLLSDLKSLTSMQGFGFREHIRLASSAGRLLLLPSHSLFAAFNIAKKEDTKQINEEACGCKTTLTHVGCSGKQ